MLFYYPLKKKKPKWTNPNGLELKAVVTKHYQPNRGIWELQTLDFLTSITEPMLDSQTFGAILPSQNTSSYHQGSGNPSCCTQMPLPDSLTKQGSNKRTRRSYRSRHLGWKRVLMGLSPLKRIVLGEIKLFPKGKGGGDTRLRAPLQAGHGDPRSADSSHKKRPREKIFRAVWGENNHNSPG